MPTQFISTRWSLYQAVRPGCRQKRHRCSNQSSGNSKFANAPVDLAVLKTDLDSLTALIAEAADGSQEKPAT